MPPTCTRCGCAFFASYAEKFPAAKVCGGCALKAMFGEGMGLPSFDSVELITSDLLAPDEPKEPIPFDSSRVLVSRELLTKLRAEAK